MRTDPTRAIATVLSAGALLVAGACATEPTTDAQKSSMHADVTAALDRFENEDPSLAPLLDRSAGYAVFPDVGKAGFIAGGGYGRGEVFERGRWIGYSKLTKGSVGAQIGAETFSELIVFTNQATLDTFKGGEFSFSADASAVAIKPGSAKATDSSKGTVIFVHTKGGLMAEASVGGQKFDFVPYTRTASMRDEDRPRYDGDRYPYHDEARK